MSTNSDTSPDAPPLVSNGPGDNGGLIVVLCYILMVIAVLFFLMRLYNTIARRKGFGFDDLAFYAATAILIIQTVLIQKAVQFGLGKHADTLSAQSLDIYGQYTYASQILSIIIQTLAKVAVVFLVLRLDYSITTVRWCKILTTVIAIWGFLSVFGIAFQCGTNRPWNYTNDRCATGGRVYYAIMSLNIATDAALAVFFLPVVTSLRMEVEQRWTVSLLFLSRLVVCCAAAANIYLVSRYLEQTDKTWYNTLPVIFMQIVCTTSVITAGVPAVYRFLADLQTGNFGVGLTEVELSGGRRSSARSPPQQSLNNIASDINSRISSRIGSGARKSQMSHVQSSGSGSKQSRVPPTEEETPLKLVPSLDGRADIETNCYASTAGSSTRPEEEIDATRPTQGEKQLPGARKVPSTAPPQRDPRLVVRHRPEAARSSSRESSHTRGGILQKNDFRQEFQDTDRDNAAGPSHSS